MIDDTAKPTSPLHPAPKRRLAIARSLYWQASIVLDCFALCIVFTIATHGFYQPTNLFDIMLQSSINCVIAVGMTLVINTRGINLSVGSIGGLSSIMALDTGSGYYRTSKL